VVTYGVRGHAWDHVDPVLPKFEKIAAGVSCGLPSGGRNRRAVEAREAPPALVMDHDEVVVVVGIVRYARPARVPTTR
jgi:hypothetical protein